jgi:hypothetical protein
LASNFDLYFLTSRRKDGTKESGLRQGRAGRLPPPRRPLRRPRHRRRRPKRQLKPLFPVTPDWTKVPLHERIVIDAART